MREKPRIPLRLKATQTGIFVIIILLEHSSILLPTCHAVAFGRRRKASSEALLNLKSVLIREIRGLVPKTAKDPKTHQSFF